MIVRQATGSVSIFWLKPVVQYLDVIAKLRYLLHEIMRYERFKENLSTSKLLLALKKYLISQNRTEIAKFHL